MNAEGPARAYGRPSRPSGCTCNCPAHRLSEDIETALRNMAVDKGRSYKIGPDGVVILWDLDLATYMLQHNVDFVDIYREGSNFRIIFRADPARVKQLHLAYITSAEGHYATVLRLLKKAAHSIGDRPLDQ